ncbi:MAG: DNA-3-methyladenine glycosylase 2 family protein [Pseudorhodoplanes sp.]
MTHFLHNQSDLADAMTQLVVADPRLAPVLDKAGHPDLRRGEPGFPGLARIICGQQLSTASARAIWGRLQGAFDPFEPEALRRARPDKLGRLGLSAAKIKSIKAIAASITKGELDLDAVAQSEADIAHQALVAMHGIGPWTADIYLLFCLGHADAWPAGDLALQEAARIAFALKARPTYKEMVALAEVWRPYRGVAAHLLWAYYHVVKRRDGAVIQTAPKPIPKIKSKAAKPAAKRKAKPDGRTKRTQP